MEKSSKSFSFLCSLFCLLQAGTVYLWSAYSTDVAHQLQYSQTQLAIIAGTGAWGLYLTGPLVGRFLHKHDVALTFRYACLCLFCGYILMALTVSKIFFFLPQWFGFMALYFFLVGLGSAGVNLAACTVNLRNFAPSKRGFALGTSVACVGLSAFVYSIASRFFYRLTVIHTLVADTSDTHETLDVYNVEAHKTLLEQGETKPMSVMALDTVGFLLFLAFMTGACNYYVSRYVVDGNRSFLPSPTKKAAENQLHSPNQAAELADLDQNRSTVSKTDDNLGAGTAHEHTRLRTASSNSMVSSMAGPSSLSATGRLTRQKNSLPQVFYHTESWLLFVVMLLVCGCGLMVISNIGSIIALTTPATMHENVPQWQSLHVSIISLFNSIFRLASGIFTDLIVSKTHVAAKLNSSKTAFSRGWNKWAYKLFLVPSRAHVLFLGCVTMMYGQSMFVPLLRPDGKIGSQSMAGAAVVGAAYGTVLCVAPTIITDWYGVGNYAVNWGWISWGPAIGGQTFNILFGKTSDRLKNVQIKEAIPSAISTRLHVHSEKQAPKADLADLAESTPFFNDTIEDERGFEPQNSSLKLEKRDISFAALSEDFYRPSLFFRKTTFACFIAAILTVIIIIKQPETKSISSSSVIH